jgi:hypothetical protein
MSYKPVIFFANPDDPTRVSIMYPADDISVDEAIRRFINPDLPYRVMEPKDFPVPDPDYDDAWQLVPSAEDASVYEVKTILERAKDVHRNHLRQQRKPMLEALDVAFMLALERADTAQQQEVAVKKQALRDITSHPAIAAAVSTAELRALTLDALLTV